VEQLMQAASEIDWGPFYLLDHIDDKVEFFNVVIPAFYNRHCPITRLRLKYCRHHLFADDSQIYYSFHPDDIDAAVRTVNEDLMAIQWWALANDLSLNASKTQVLFCGSPYKLIIVKRSLTELLFLNGAELTFSEVVKNVGALFDESLSGKDQVNYVIRQVYLRLRQLYYFSRLALVWNQS
jgi:hypothetical protein